MNSPVITSGRPVIQWRDYYSVGNLELDGQHQKIIHMINWLYEVIWEGDDRQGLATLMRRVSEYTHSHFVDEERMMRDAGFPGYLDHKEIHDNLTSDTRDLLFGCLQDEGPDSRDLLRFLKRWWINHITGDDKEYMYFLSNRERAALVDQALFELMGALIENEQRLQHYYELMGDYVPEHRSVWQALQAQEQGHGKLLQQIRRMVEESPTRFAAGKFTANAARTMTRDVNGMIEKIERGEVHPKYAISFAADIEQALLESHLEQAIKTDVVEVQNMLSGLSEDTASHRGLLRGIAD